MKKTTLILFVALVMTILPLSGIVQASTIPTISIQGVTKNDKVTVMTHNFPANKDFTIRMGLFGTKGIDGILVGMINSQSGGSLMITVNIPVALHSESEIAIRLDSTTGGYYSYNWFTNTDFGSHTGGNPPDQVTLNPGITVVSVKKDINITVKGIDFPKDESFYVLMGLYGTEGKDGVMVDTITAGEDMSFLEIFDIPASLVGESKIAIRFESKDSDLVIVSSFANETGASGGSTTDGIDGYTGIPTISVLSVQKDLNVTIQAHNFPKDKDFNVLMGFMGTRGIGGTQVTTIHSGDGGSFSKTFDIPSTVKGKYQIAIRLQTADGYFYAYNWFYNNTTGTGTIIPSAYTGIPTFSISSVEKDKTVTIKTNNFPAHIDFNVLMGKYGTKGMGGIHVSSINTGTGGTFSQTFTIPSSLSGNNQIAIRMEAISGGFYAYNWFYNNTYP